MFIYRSEQTEIENKVKQEQYIGYLLLMKLIIFFYGGKWTYEGL